MPAHVRDLAQGGLGVRSDTVVIQLEIDFYGTVLWNGSPVTVDSLDGYFRREAANDPQPESCTSARTSARRTTSLRACWRLRRNGLLKIGFVGNEQFM